MRLNYLKTLVILLSLTVLIIANCTEPGAGAAGGGGTKSTLASDNSGSSPPIVGSGGGVGASSVTALQNHSLTIINPASMSVTVVRDDNSSPVDLDEIPNGVVVRLEASSTDDELEFNSWKGDIKSESPSATLLIDDDKSVVALFSGTGGGVILYNDAVGADINEDGTITEDEKNLMASLGKKYLEAAPTDWYNEDGTNTGVWASIIMDIRRISNIKSQNSEVFYQSIGKGSQFTKELVSHAEGSGISGSAAQLCSEYNGGGKDDWFLPSVGEVLLAFQNEGAKAVVPIGNIWTSSEYSSSFGWIYNMNWGYIDLRSKGNAHYVHPIRAF